MSDPDDADLAVVRRLLVARDAASAGLTRFAAGVPVFRVDRGAAEPWVVRIGRGLERYAAALSVLERIGCPAARVVPDGDGRVLVDLRAATGETTQGLVITYVDGDPTPFEPTALGGVGAALGALHAKGAEAVRAAAAAPVPGLPTIERAGMLPANELAFGLRCLRGVEDQVVPAARSQWQRLIDACERGREPVDGLTTVFLHGDAHPWNCLRQPSGDVCWIDWDSAGPGPAVIDLAFLAVSCDTGGLIGPIVAPDPRRLDAVLDAYAERVTLTGTDLDALEDALAFRVLVCAAVGFAAFTRKGVDPLDEPSIHWSLDRWAAVPALADRMRHRLTGDRRSR